MARPTICVRDPLTLIDSLEFQPMARLRMFLACLLLIAIPLQGLAAASMLFCDSDSRQASVEHDHAMHQHAGHDQVQADDNEQPGDSVVADSGHTCSVCAACCHSAAISETPQVPAFSPVYQTVWAQPLVLVHSRPSPVPDKPPRA